MVVAFVVCTDAVLEEKGSSYVNFAGIITSTTFFVPLNGHHVLGENILLNCQGRYSHRACLWHLVLCVDQCPRVTRRFKLQVVIGRPED